MNGILEITPSGLYCSSGDFYIDPRQPVKRAVITHAHADHARGGSRSYLCSKDSEIILRSRLGREARIDTLDYGENLTINSVNLSLHPAGHILGSAQVKIDKAGYCAVVSGDFKTHSDPTCAPLENLRCHTFISESTFGLPIFRWPDPDQIMGEINSWWQTNRDQGRTSILFAYALGKAQRILACLDPSLGPILTHGAIENMNDSYRNTGISLPATQHVDALEDKTLLPGALVIAPPSANNPVWMRRFKQPSRAFASGWMRIRGNRRRRSVDRGFVLSDHADWDGLLQTITASNAEKIVVTHGYSSEMVNWLLDQGYDAEVMPTDFGDETDMQGDQL